MTYAEILASYGRFGIHLGLERIEQLLADLGNPHHQVPIIHVAGTNGKGSVCAYLSSILAAAGYKVGRYISPHLVDWRERICINNVWISSADLVRALQTVESVVVAEALPTQFELLTAAMWWYFAQSKVDVAVIETGLGGRLDATNVCDRPLVAVITSISRDHWQRLGDSLEAIASEKAGIIKPHCPVVVGELPAAAATVMAHKAASCQAPITWVKPQLLDYPIPLLGQHQIMNAAIAIAAIKSLQNQGWLINDQAISSGIEQTQWQGRLQWAEYQSQPILLDGAHNQAAALCLRTFVDSTYSNHTKHWIMGMLDTKDYDGILRSLLRPPDLLFLVPVTNHQSANLQTMQAIANTILQTPAQIFPNLQLGLEAAYSNYQPSDLMILCGSLYLVGEFLT